MLTISAADLDDPGLAGFLRAHLADMAPTAPAESRHALDLRAFEDPGVRLWVAREGAMTVGTAALTSISPEHEELKTMRTAPSHRGRGIAGQMLDHVLTNARARGVRRVSLETGTADFFAPARHLYARAGFDPTEPFGTYVEDPHSVFMTIRI